MNRNNELKHYGTKRHSGRYPFGSGQDPQRSKDILDKYDELRERGMNDVQIAKELGMTTTRLRDEKMIAKDKRKQYRLDAISTMQKEGLSQTEMANKLGVSEGTIRNYLKPKDKVTKTQVSNIADALKEELEKTPYLDVGKGVELQMNISKEKLRAATKQLEEEGYSLHSLYLPQLTDYNKRTTYKVLTKEPDYRTVLKNSADIRTPQKWTDDGGLTMQGLKPIEHLSFDKVAINYGGQGGELKDGVIEVRRGAPGLDLGNSSYAQVRIGVGGTHYAKGVAVYAPETWDPVKKKFVSDIPEGCDIRFNTNKPVGTSKEDVLKKLKDNPDNPFGATIKVGGQRGKLNIVNEEGDWDKWASTISAQFLSKQPRSFVKERLDATYKSIQKEFDEINALDNPAIKQKMLRDFSEEVQTSTRHLKALSVPRAKSQLILPYPEMNATEVYAPNFKDGETVVLVRYPHGGTFELAELRVNNKAAAPKKQIGNAADAIGIHPSVAQKLSGADFDGDTVMVIPNNQGKIKVSKSLKELQNFDPNQYHVDYKTIDNKTKQRQMGIVSNLITDMTIKDAPQSDIVRAVRHSMVVIDSEKHQLDYKQSAIDNGISALHEKYQGSKRGGASTIISKSKKDFKVTEVNPNTGKERRVTKYLMDETPDARALSSGRKVENDYADYANSLKALSSKAASISESIHVPTRDPNAARKYSNEVLSLTAKIKKAEENAPKERQAQLLATKTYYKNLNYDMDKEEKKKLKSQALGAARIKVEAKRNPIDITPNEWDAIQNNALSKSKVQSILLYGNPDQLRQYATPRKVTPIPSNKLSQARQMLNNGYPMSTVADQVGVSVSKLRSQLKESGI